MAPTDRCLASMAKLAVSTVSSRPTAYLLPQIAVPAFVQSRQASVVRIKKTATKKKAVPKDFKRRNIDKTELPQFSLCQAMRVIRATEVGNPPASIKYEVHVNLKTARNGPVIKDSIRLPHPVKSDWKIAVICPEGSEIALAATAAGAVAVGEEKIFESIRQETYTFDRLICHESSEAALNKAGLGRLLGPKGMMPNRRMKTIVADVVRSMRDSSGAADYRERDGCIRLAIGQLGFTPDQLKANIQALLKKVKTEAAHISEESPKEVHEVILSSTNGPGLSLNGKLHDESDKITVQDLSGAM